MRPTTLRLEASTACQLRCPSCPTAAGEIGEKLGTGFLRLADFAALVAENRWLDGVELSNWGEVFLSPELLPILRHAHERGVTITMSNGTNLNFVRAEVLEGLVRYGVRHITCSIDGVTQETYATYRRRGRLDRVLANIRRINELKARYGSSTPRLTWQFVVFGHNEHELAAARRMASELDMDFYAKLSWGDMYDGTTFSPVRDREALRRELGVADRAEYEATHGRSYVRRICAQLWQAPQVNHDGRVLGCCVNHWGDFGNAFDEGLTTVLDGERMRHARAMLRGQAAPRDDIPCSTCSVYHGLSATQRWLTPEEVDVPFTVRRLAKQWLRRSPPLLRLAQGLAARLAEVRRRLRLASLTAARPPSR